MKTPVSVVMFALSAGILAGLAVGVKSASAEAAQHGAKIERHIGRDYTLNVVRLENGRACVWVDGGRADCTMPAPPAPRAGGAS